MAPLVQITTRHFVLPASAEAVVRGEFSRLETLSRHIIGCRVLIGIERRGYSVRVDLNLPDGVPLVTRSTHEELAQAIRLAFSAAQHQVEDHARYEEQRSYAAG